MENLIFVGIEHGSGNASTFVGIDITGEILRFGARSLDDIAKRIANEFGEDFEEHVTLQVPENISGPCYELTSSDKELLKILIEKCLAKEKYPGYMEIMIKEIEIVNSTTISVFPKEINIQFLIGEKTKRKFDLPHLSVGDTLFIKGKFGNDFEKLICTRLAGIKV